MVESAAWPGQVLRGTAAPAVWLPRGDWEGLRVRGPDRAAWLNGLLTNNVVSVRPGVAGWGLALNKQGKIQCELWLVADSEALLVFAPQGQARGLAEVLDRFLIMEDAELELAPELRLFALIGPGAREHAEALAESPEVSWGELDFLGLGGALLAAPSAPPAEVQPGAAVELVSDGLNGRLRQRLGEPLSLLSWAALRAEWGLPEWGVDYNADSNPHEAGLAHRARGAQPVDWQKGCYLGQEVVCMQDLRGKVRRSLFPLVIEVSTPESAEIAPGAEVSADSVAVGQLRSSSACPELGGVVGFAQLKTSAVEQDLRIGGHPAKVLGPKVLGPSVPTDAAPKAGVAADPAP